jgi:hypothetical protein
LRMARRKERGRGGQVGSWCGSSRGHRDRDDRRQDGGAAEQHRLVIYGGDTDDSVSELSANVQHGLTGAYRHHNLDLLVHLVVHLDQLEFDDATDMDASRRRIGGSCHHPAPSQLHILLTADALLGWHVACVYRRGESGVGVFMSATLALQPDVSAFLAPLWLVLRGT